MPEYYDCPEGYPTCTFRCKFWKNYEGPTSELTPEEIKRIESIRGCHHPKLSHEESATPAAGLFLVAGVLLALLILF